MASPRGHYPSHSKELVRRLLLLHQTNCLFWRVYFMKQLLLGTLLVCLSFQIIGCTRGTDSTEAAREPERMTDSDLEKKIEMQISSDPQLRNARLSISADAE